MGSACASDLSTNNVNRTVFAVTTWSQLISSPMLYFPYFWIRHSMSAVYSWFRVQYSLCVIAGIFKSETWRASSLARWKSCACCSILMLKTSTFLPWKHSAVLLCSLWSLKALLSLSTRSTACGGKPNVSYAKQWDRSRHEAHRQVLFLREFWALIQRVRGPNHAPWVDCSTWQPAPLFF